jgi:hypothetical protein
MALVLGLGLTVSFGVAVASVRWGALTGIGTVVGLMATFKWRPSRNLIARLPDWIIDRP